MKTFTFRYDPASPIPVDAFPLLPGGATHDSLSCPNMESMLRLMTKSRFEIFTAIVEKSPNSLSDLARSMGKDLGNVLRDAKVLESLGLIRLERMIGRRGKRLVPMALFGRIVFECQPQRDANPGHAPEALSASIQ